MTQEDCVFVAEYSIEESEDQSASPDFRVTSELPGSRTQTLSVEVGGDRWSIELVPMRDYSRRALSQIVPTSDRFVFCAVVDGSVFIVDVRHPESASFVDTGGAVTGVGYADVPGLVLLATDWEVFAVNGPTIAWRSGRIAIEGIRLGQVDGTRLVGVADEHTDEPRTFLIDLTSGAVAGGSSCQ